MKFKTTTKAIKNGYANIFRCGYCDLQNLLRHEQPKAYCSGVYGWNFDVFEIDGIAITTGYRGMVGEHIPSEIIKKYELKAKKIIDGGNFDYKKIKSGLDRLIKKFVEELRAVKNI